MRGTLVKVEWALVRLAQYLDEVDWAPVRLAQYLDAVEWALVRLAPYFYAMEWVPFYVKLNILLRWSGPWYV